MCGLVRAIYFALLLIVSTSALPSSTVEGDGGFRTIALEIHNSYRKQINATPLRLDPELNKLAHAHAEKLAASHQLSPSHSGFYENLWSHSGELLPLAKDCEYAIKNWYTGSQAPGKVHSIVDPRILKTDYVSNVGFGVGTSETTGEGYSVVVAFYS